MPDVFTKAKRSDVMSRIRSRGNEDTELALIRVFRAHRITGWRRQISIVIGNSRREEAHSERPPSTNPKRKTVRASSPRLTSESGFRVSQAAAGGLRGWLLLARLPAARDEAPEQRGLLAEEVRREHKARSAGEPRPASVGLARVAHLGTRTAPSRRTAVGSQTNAGPGSGLNCLNPAPPVPSRTARGSCPANPPG